MTRSQTGGRVATGRRVQAAVSADGLHQTSEMPASPLLFGRLSHERLAHAPRPRGAEMPTLRQSDPQTRPAGREMTR